MQFMFFLKEQFLGLSVKLVLSVAFITSSSAKMCLLKVFAAIMRSSCIWHVPELHFFFSILSMASETLALRWYDTDLSGTANFGAFSKP